MGRVTCPKSQRELAAELGLEPGPLGSYERFLHSLEEKHCSCILVACGSVYLRQIWGSPALAVWPLSPPEVRCCSFPATENSCWKGPWAGRLLKQ